MTGNGTHTTYKNVDDWGLFMIILPTFIDSSPEKRSLIIYNMTKFNHYMMIIHYDKHDHNPNNIRLR